jgi:hypothetical protein
VDSRQSRFVNTWRLLFTCAACFSRLGTEELAPGPVGSRKAILPVGARSLAAPPLSFL